MSKAPWVDWKALQLRQMQWVEEIISDDL